MIEIKQEVEKKTTAVDSFERFTERHFWRESVKSKRNGGYEGRRQDGGKRNGGSVGGKAKQVYVEKRRKQEEEEWERKKEIWKQRRKQHKQEEAKCLVGVEFSGANTQTEESLEKKNVRNAWSIQTSAFQHLMSREHNF